ncbi:unnamed protein product [Caenorhabditis bovis]|uniref:TIL domain-containing protein n=1 Tax=Caenorhabditis bovis TaxID=2654633 RepID=A0A8S1E760_9PELO|nr:unnamed protein product [Caenorhabditis bovis]
MKLIVLLFAFASIVYCIKQCKENEEIVACSSGCEPRCGYTPKVCPEICITGVCECKDEFVRSTQGDCIHPLNCTKETTKCPPNETFQTCGTQCEPTCEVPEPPFCTEACVMNTCQCSEGYVRLGHTCVKKSECPK